MGRDLQPGPPETAAIDEAIRACLPWKPITAAVLLAARTIRIIVCRHNLAVLGRQVARTLPNKLTN